MKTNTRLGIPKPTKTLILCTPGASSQIARRARCSKTLVSLVLAGKRNCPERLWSAVSDWLAEPRTDHLRKMAVHEMRAR